jgi:hypothetical protein
MASSAHIASAGISSILPFTPRLKRAEELPYTLRIYGLLAPEVEWGRYRASANWHKALIIVTLSGPTEVVP